MANFSNVNAFAIPVLLQTAVGHFREGKLDQAAAVCEQILSGGAAHPDALHLLGIIRLKANRPQDAAPLIRRAIAVNAKIPAYHKNLAESLRLLRDLPGAEAAYRKAIELSPNDAQSLSNLAGILRQQERREESIELLQRAVVANPAYVQGFNNLGTTLADVGRLDEAETALRTALKLVPNYASAHNNLGLVHMRREESEKALAEFDRAIAINPDYADAHWHKAMNLLLEGKLHQGWREYDWRFLTSHADTPRNKPLSHLLPGMNVRGMRVHCCSEQGLGDAIQFSRFALELADRGAEVSMDAAPELRELFKSLPLTITAKESPAPDADVVTPLMSLPMYFDTTPETIPRKTPYLSADPEKVRAWQDRIPAGKEKRIGFVTQGASRHPNNANRNCVIDHWAPLFSVPGTKWYSLQLPAPAALPPAIVDLSPHLADLSDTAAAMMNLDLIISVDTSAAHLAAALGKPTWVMLAFGPDWRWLRRREDSPWYPSVRLFRQARRGEWDSVIAQIATALAE